MAGSARHTPAVVIGAGHAGLAVSHRLAERSIQHVVLERGEVANSWRTERRESLRLLTPNWHTRLPGASYEGDDPDGFMTMPEIVEFITTYADAISAPVRTHTTVTNVRSHRHGYLVETDRGDWTCDSVVIASGGANVANVPAASAHVPESVEQIDAITYRSPGDLDDRTALVVGASATGVQLADEISRSGRAVVLAVGEHVRMPRTYRGRDIFWWMDRAGVLDEGRDDVDDLERARRLPSPQLVGTVDHRSVDLDALTDRGVDLTGRLMAIHGGVAQFSGSLANVCALADLKLNRLLQRFDNWADACGISGIEAPERFGPTRVPSQTRLELDFAADGIGTVVWATGFRPDYTWLDLPVFDGKGRIRHDGGVTESPGLYVTGLNVLRHRRSSYIGGAVGDSEAIGDHLAEYLERCTPSLGRQSPAPDTPHCVIDITDQRLSSE